KKHNVQKLLLELTCCLMLMFYRKIEASAQAPTQIILIRLLKSLDFRLVELDYYTDPIQRVNIYFQPKNHFNYLAS
ncbi:MAG: hypothetical protein Q8N35_03305, partial [Methylococcaceae bacterium]|nr:hypothetical protein [Methylococcaceae bacterium]